MRLSELNPKWMTLNYWVAQEIFYTGIRFKCPHCGIKLVIPFKNPIDPKQLNGSMFIYPEQVGWERTGDSFETLTLSPSIDFSSSGHFHGHITNGEVTFA